MEIRVVVPLCNKQFEMRTAQELSAVARPDTEVSVVCLDKGPLSIESRYETAMAVPDTLAKIVQAEKDGVGAVMVNCMCDVGVEASRELVSIPVIGPAETSMHIASMLGYRFSVIDILERTVPDVEDRARQAGVIDQLASVRSVNIPVLELGHTPKLRNALIDQSVKAVREDGAHVIIFGCTGMAGMAGDVEEGLKEHGITDVPVIDPTILTLKIAEALAGMGLSHSKRTYPAPPEKEIVGY